MKKFTFDFINELSEKGSLSSRGRQHHNIHESYKNSVQRVFNAIGIDSYIQPHRHSLDNKTETLIAISGCFVLILFSKSGAITEIVPFSSEKYDFVDSVSCCVEVDPGAWHTVVGMTPGSVLLEIKAGPFSEHGAKEYAKWSQGEGSSESINYFNKLKETVYPYCFRDGARAFYDGLG